MTNPNAFHVEPEPLTQTPKQAKALCSFAELVRRENDRLGLVSPAALDKLDQALISPCQAFAGLATFRQAQMSIVDLGSGGGFPGIPLAIAWPEHQVLLVDSQLKKCDFLRRVVAELALPNVRVLHARVEKITTLGPPSLFTARFFKDLRTIATWTRHWRQPGTRYLLFSGAGEPVANTVYNLSFVHSHKLTDDKVALEYVTI